MARLADDAGSIGRFRSAGAHPPLDVTAGANLDSTGEMRVALLRSRKFRALSTLFTLDVANYEQAIGELLEPCGVVVDCPVANGSTRPAAEDALAWTRNVGNVSGLYAEHVRLFGGPDLRVQMPQVAASGGLYAANGPLEADDSMLELYASNKFRPRSDCPCPSYIANELEFMGHLLEQAAHGQSGAIDTARDFIVAHLYTWGIVFSAATHARSEHPVTRFAGLMLEHMLFCETHHARAYDLSYRVLREGAPV